jgi:hypothetical protein
MCVSLNKTILSCIVLSCLMCFIGGCGGMSAADIEKIVRKDSGSLGPHVASYLGMVMGGSVSLSEVKVESIYKKASLIPPEWRDPSHDFAVVEELAKYQKEKLCYAVVNLKGICQGYTGSRGPGVLSPTSANFEGKVLYAVTKTRAIPFPVWQMSK